LIPVNEPRLGALERSYLLDCLDTGWISSRGPYLARFEQEFAAYCGVRHGVATTNGTAALHVALAALGIGPGDEVVIPTLTMAATAFAVVYTGATPVLVDSEPLRGNLDPAQLEARITPRTRAILVVHLYGHPVDMDPIHEIAQRHGLPIIEDAAEAHGATYRGRRAGSLGTIACFSFYANKIVTSGEGGMVLTDDDALADRARRLRDMAHSPSQRFLHEELGFNYRLTNLQAALGLAQLHQIDDALARKRHMAERYGERLAGLRGLHLPDQAPWAESVYWMYAVVVDEPLPLDRDVLMTALAAEGIETRSFFIPMHLQPALLQMGLFSGERYPVAEDLGRRGLYLPSGLAITDEQIDLVAAAIRRIASQPRRHPEERSDEGSPQPAPERDPSLRSG